MDSGAVPATGRLPQLGVASFPDARGLSRHDRASIYHNSRPGKCLRDAKGEKPATTLIRDHGTHSTTLRKR